MKKSNDATALVVRNSKRGFSLENDGVDHINVYSHGATDLGRKLSHFCYSQFLHPYFGPFYSMEGFWYFMRNGKLDDTLRYLYGRKAKVVGRMAPARWYSDFKEDILAANYQKIIQNRDINDLFVASTLPLDHYYKFKSRAGLEYLINPKDNDWLIDGLQDIRTALQKGEVPQCWINAEDRYKRG